MLGKLNSHLKKDETKLLSYTISQINSKCIKDLNIRPETIKLLKEHTGGKLLDWSWRYFGSDTKNKVNKSKNEQELFQTKNLLQKKGNKMKINRPSMEWKNT